MNQTSRSLARRARTALARARRLARRGLTLSLALSVVVGLAPLAPPAVSAQTGGDGPEAPSKGGRFYAPRAERRAFLLRAEGGGLACDVATPAETQTYAPAKGRKPELVQINHLGAEAGGGASHGLHIILNATPQLASNPAAVAAFTRAASNWEQVILSPITVNIDVDYGTTAFGTPFGSDVLGVTLGQELTFLDNYPQVRRSLVHSASSTQEQTLYANLPAEPQGVPTDLAAGNIHETLIASPTARAIGEIRAAADRAEDDFYGDTPRIGFNSNPGSGLSFDFNPDDGIGGSQLDFDAIATHEIGHVLGFVSEEGVMDEFPTATPLVSTWDIFRFPDTTASVANFNTKQRTLRKTVPNQFEFNGKNPAPLPLTTGGPSGNGGDGEQAGHWQDRTAGNTIGIMDPRISSGERNVIKATDLRALDAMGFRVNVDGGPGLPAPAPPVHDNRANAKLLPSGSGGGDFYSSRYATIEAGEPTHHSNVSFPSGRSAWYRWEANGGGTATVATANSNFDTILAAYRLDGNTLTVLNKNDDVGQNDLTSLVQINAVAGQVYYFAVDGFLGAGGDVSFQYNLPGTPPPATTITLSASNVAVGEGTPRVDITATRGGTTTGTSTVSYATSNITAEDGKDYLASLGTLTFSPGETQKTISVFILNDVYGEGAETFRLELSNPVNASLVAPSVTTIQINSDEATDGLNPMRTTTNGVPSFNADFFVRQQYLDFFNREGDQAGVDFWRNQITACGADQGCIDFQKERVSSEFFRSIEFQTTGYFVYRAYAAAFGPTRIGNTVPLTLREFLPDTQAIGRGIIVGQGDWQAQLEANRAAFVSDFVNRTAFLAVYSTAQTPAQFVDAMNANTGGSLSAAERDAAINEFGGAGNIGDQAARARALRRVIEDVDFANRERNRAFVLMQYFGYMRRNPPDPPELTLDYQGYNFWLGKLNEFGGDAVAAQMVKAFIISEEYKLRFGP